MIVLTDTIFSNRTTFGNLRKVKLCITTDGLIEPLPVHGNEICPNDPLAGDRFKACVELGWLTIAVTECEDCC